MKAKNAVIVGLLIISFSAIGYAFAKFTAARTAIKPEGTSADSAFGLTASNTSSHMANHAMTGMKHSAAPAETQMTLSAAEQKAQDQTAQAVTDEQALVPKILSDGTKQFTLTASVFPWHLFIGQTVAAWGYNHQVCGPLIRVKVGDKVEVVVHNQLPEPTTVHWHGLSVPNDMDGVPDVTQPPIEPGGTFTYRFIVTSDMVGTHYYHSHVDDDFQEDNGLYGPMIVDPATPESTHYDVDAFYMLSSFKIQNSELENVFCMNGKPYPEAPELNVKLGQTVRIRLVNASAEEVHTMHLHGYTFQVIARDGSPVAHPESMNTVMLGPGMSVDIAFKANHPGKWMFHCHVLDHTMNPDDPVDAMGGLMTYINVK